MLFIFSPYSISKLPMNQSHYVPFTKKIVLCSEVEIINCQENFLTEITGYRICDKKNCITA